MRSPAVDAPWALAYPPDPDTGERSANPRQLLAHNCHADVLFYGGQVGGGKTDWLVTEAMNVCVRFPGIDAYLFRRTREELKKAILSRLLNRVPRRIARWVKSDHCFYWRNDAKLYLEFLDRDDDVYRYQSAEMGWAGIDEAGQLNEFPVSYILGRVRSTHREWPKRLCLAGNPDGPGVGWLKRWFIKPRPEELGGRPAPKPMEIWRPLPRLGDPSPPEHVPTRCFIPASFYDNAVLQKTDPSYLARVYQVNKLNVARRLAEGLWDIDDAMVVGGAWFDSLTVHETDTQLLSYDEIKVGQTIQWHVIQNDTWRPPKGALIYGSVDYGYGSPWSFHLHAVLPGGHSRTFYEIYSPRVKDRDQALRIQRALEQDVCYRDGGPVITGLQWVVYDPSMDNSRQEMGLAKSIKEVYADVLGGRVSLLPGAGGRGARLSRPQRWLDALATAADGFPHWSVTTACPDLIRTLPEVPWDPDDTDVEDDHSESHAYEDVGRFFEARPFAPRATPPDPYAHLDQVSAAHHRAMDQAAAPKRGGGLGGLSKR